MINVILESPNHIIYSIVYFILSSRERSGGLKVFLRGTELNFLGGRRNILC